MDRIKLKALQGLEKVLSKVASGKSWYRRRYVQWKDDKFGRERVNTDRYGNSYYQYYSYHGLPTRRIVLYKYYDEHRFIQDPHFVGWLRKNEMIAPTPEELEQLYLKHDAFIERGIEWDENEKQLLKAWEERKLELDEKFPDQRQQIGAVHEWNPNIPK